MSDDFGSPRRVEWHLDNWRRWMRNPELRLEYPSKAAGFIAGGYYTRIEDWEADCDRWCAETINTLIQSLSPAEEAAVHHRYLNAVYRFNREPHYIVLERAKVKLGIGLKKWGIL